MIRFTQVQNLGLQKGWSTFKVIAIVYWESIKLMIFSPDEYSTLVDDPWTPCLTYCIQYFMFDWVQVKGEVSTTIQTSLN